MEVVVGGFVTIQVDHPFVCSQPVAFGLFLSRSPLLAEMHVIPSVRMKLIILIKIIDKILKMPLVRLILWGYDGL